MDVIFTTSIGFGIDAIRPFVETSRRCTNTSLYILQAGLDATALDYLRNLNVQVRPWPDELTKESVVANRFTHYLSLIEREDVRFRRAMFTDIRDVLFQADPFAQSEPYRIKVFAEEVRFRDSEINRQWLRRRYGAKTLREFDSKPVICAGVTFASYDGAIDYLGQMSRASDEKRRDLFFGTDQALHNFLIYSGALNGVEVVANRTGEVQTMGLQGQFRLDGQGRVLNDDGTVCPVLHQYDRHVIFGKYMLETMGFKRITADATEARLDKLERVLNSRSRLTKRWLKVMVSGRAPL